MVYLERENILIPGVFQFLEGGTNSVSRPVKGAANHPSQQSRGRF